MKSLGVLLLIAVALSAAYWKTQRPGEGVAELKADAVGAMQRLAAGVQTVRSGVDASAVQLEDRYTVVDSGDDLLAARSEIDDTTSALGARIDALENELTRTMTSSEAGVVENRLDMIDERLTGLARIPTDAGVGSDVTDALTGRLDAIDGRLQLLDRRLEEQDPFARLDELGARVDTLVERFDASDSALDRRLAAADAERADLAERGDTASARLASIAAGGSAGSADGSTNATSGIGIDAALDARLASLEKSLSGSRADGIRVGTLDTRLAELATRLDSLAERDDTLAQSVSLLRSSLDELATDSQALSIDSVQQQIADQLENLDADVQAGAASEDGVGALSEALDATRERIEQLETQVENLPASSSAADSAQENQSALESQIAALERRLETLPQETDPALVTSLDEVRDQVDKLNARGFVTQEELRAQVEGKNVEYKIYFDKNSTAITDEASRVLDSFIAQETNRTTGVAIFGFTDRRGPASYNQQLAQRRASNVRSYLIQNGFDYTRIGNVAGLGEDAAALLEDDQEDALQRVVVLYAAQRQ